MFFRLDLHSAENRIAASPQKKIQKNLRMAFFVKPESILLLLLAFVFAALSVLADSVACATW